MKSALKENAAEALVGLAVVLLAALFALFALQRTGAGFGSDAIHVKALFPSAVGVGPGTDVRVAGVKVGTIDAQKLDPQSFQVEMSMALDPNMKLPSDSSAAITSEGLLGGNYVALIPGGSETPLKSGDTIADTQGSVDLMGLVGQFINKTGSGGGASSSSGAGGMDAAPAASTPAP